MMKSMLALAGLLLAAAAVPAIAGPIEVRAEVFAEHREAAADGTTAVRLERAARVTPGDRVVLQLSYRNTGGQVIEDVVLDNPVPPTLAYVAPASGSPTPKVSVDGTRFDDLAVLQVRGDDGALRAANPADVRVVRWVLDRPLAPGASGTLAFQAVLR